jgi:hypothetical protein
MAVPWLLRAWASTTGAPAALATWIASSQVATASANRARSIRPCPSPARTRALATVGPGGTSRIASW